MKNIKLEEGLIDKIKQILKKKKSDAQAIQDISDIIDFAPVIWSDDDDKPKKQGQRIRVDEAKEDKEKCVLCGKHFENKKKKVSESLDDEENEIGYMVVFGDDPDNFNEVRNFSKVFDTEEEAVQFVKDELALSEYRFAIVDEEEPSGSGRTFTVNPQGEVEEVTGNYWKYSYTDYEDEDTDYEDDYYIVSELDDEGDPIEELKQFTEKDSAIEYADSLSIPACVQYIYYDEEVEREEDDIIYYNKKAREMGLNESLTEDKEKCVLCGKEIKGYGNNPAPLADEGKCCDSCNSKRVIPARLKAMKVNKMDEDNESLTEDSAIDKLRAADPEFDKTYKSYEPSNTYKLIANIEKVIENLISSLSNFMKTTAETTEDNSTPCVNVYIDGSGSFGYYIDKSTKLKSFIANINKYANQYGVEAKINYFGDTINNNPKSVGGGTSGAILLNHIEKTNPQSVIVITDDDIADCRKTITVPGAVWLIFIERKSNNLISHLQGELLNKLDIIQDFYESYNSSMNLQECDQFEYDDDYIIDYEDEPKKEMEYDDDYSFRR